MADNYQIEKNDGKESVARCKRGRVAKIVVDKNVCIGAGSCVVVTPGVFQLDKENKAYIVDPNTANEDELLLSAQSCPVLAIKLYDEEGKQIWPEAN